MKSSQQSYSTTASKKESLPVEIQVAAAWWASRTNDLSSNQAMLFRENLSTRLFEQYRGHWWNDDPMRGNAYRAILFDETNCERVLSTSAQDSFISQFERRLPAEAVVMWIDPGCVSVKYLISGKVKVLYDSSDPSYAQVSTNSPVEFKGSPSPLETMNCSQEYSNLQISSSHSNVAPPQRV